MSESGKGNVKGFDRAAKIRQYNPVHYGLTLGYIQAHIVEWITLYGAKGFLTIKWLPNEQCFHEPTLCPVALREM